MANKVPNVILNNGKQMPILGLGTWKSAPGEVAQAVKDAIDIGYRHFDCAHVYGNEHEVGEGINAKITEGVVKREDIFITSKLWNTFHRPDLVRGACETTLKNLNTPYLDMYLIHWPMGYKEDGELFPTDDKGAVLFSDVDYVDTWKEMEKLVDDGLCKSIGVSNFNKRQIERVLQIAKIPPANNQVECHPYLTQTKLMEYCKTKNIAITAYSPLGSPDRPWAQKGEPVLMEDPKLMAIAEKHKKSTAQVLIRYQIQRGNIVIPKSVNKGRMSSNFDVFGFELSADEIATIDSFDCNGRFVPLTNVLGHPHHPFEHDEF
ncbi:aldo-keto reductase family 1 member B1-like isoform X1 [Condylostylus longicornis]|uniref:aldo-keto reductase family 1 member B1-like isoform X1 n=1 Tax=Condylostylus longicornis TaxID=2530218 RepID=UPI00244E2A36|nr:aldo-keto reductase family 1 member B1-like isoform X1 [Condylostylus longicornis]